MQRLLLPLCSNPSRENFQIFCDFLVQFASNLMCYNIDIGR